MIFQEAWDLILAAETKYDTELVIDRIAKEVEDEADRSDLMSAAQQRIFTLPE